MPGLAVPAFRVTMSDNTPCPPPPTVTVSLEPDCSPTHHKTKRNLLSTLKNSPSMLRRRIKPPHLNHSANRNSWDSADSVSPASTPSSFTGKEFHVKYQGRVRVTTLQVSEAVNAVKKLAPELAVSSSASSSTEDLLNSTTSSQSLSSAPSSPSLTLPRSSSPTSPVAVPKSPRLAKSPKSFVKSCCLSISKQCVCIDDEEKYISETIPIATVAYCATDLRYPRAVALIRKAHGSVLMCHVFICSSRDKAEKIVAFIGKAFESAWQDWKSNHDPSALAAKSPNNNYDYIIRGRSKSHDQISRASPTGSPVLHIPARHSSYDMRNDGFSSSPEDD